MMSFRYKQQPFSGGKSCASWNMETVMTDVYLNADTDSKTGPDQTRTTRLSEHFLSPESYLAGKPSGKTNLLSEPCPPSQRTPFWFTFLPLRTLAGCWQAVHTLQALCPSLADRSTLSHKPHITFRRHSEVQCLTDFFFPAASGFPVPDPPFLPLVGLYNNKPP
ncbi:hypothetical protein AMECASPLE_038364 [Ameca splendens]|uniref:Uncharacterized protein n=1 Tax=Ameca splendens TaxID=208324 RepID=A0ABV1AEK3_9TELE